MYKIVIEINYYRHISPIYCDNIREAWYMAKSIARKFTSKSIFPIERPRVYVSIYKDGHLVFGISVMYKDGYYSLIRSRDLHHIIVRDGEHDV